MSGREVDVLVAGGGVAGACAAIAAARRGCRTLLIEQRRALGGIGSRGELRTICGLYVGGPASPAETLNGGVAREIALRLQALSPARAPERMGRTWILPYVSRELEQVLADLCSGEANLEVITGWTVTAVSSSDGEVSRITAAQGNAGTQYWPKAVIDCTGGGAVALQAGAGADLASPEEVQLAGYIIRVRGIVATQDSLSLMVPFVLAAAVNDRELPKFVRFTTFSRGVEQDEGYLKLSCDPANSEREVRSCAERAVGVLRDRLPPFQDASIAGTSEGLLEREGRRIRGEYTLTEDDILSCRTFEDSAAKNAWPIEIWDRGQGVRYRHLPDGGWYDIPLRCLVVKGFRNLLTAGRCISVTHEALGSTRVMGTCMAVGDSAGRAAASLVLKGSYLAMYES